MWDSAIEELERQQAEKEKTIEANKSLEQRRAEYPSKELTMTERKWLKEEKDKRGLGDNPAQHVLLDLAQSMARRFNSPSVKDISVIQAYLDPRKGRGKAGGSGSGSGGGGAAAGMDLLRKHAMGMMKLAMSASAAAAASAASAGGGKVVAGDEALGASSSSSSSSSSSAAFAPASAGTGGVAGFGFASLSLDQKRKCIDTLLDKIKRGEIAGLTVDALMGGRNGDGDDGTGAGAASSPLGDGSGSSDSSSSSGGAAGGFAGAGVGSSSASSGACSAYPVAPPSPLSGGEDGADSDDIDNHGDAGAGAGAGSSSSSSSSGSAAGSSSSASPAAPVAGTARWGVRKVKRKLTDTRDPSGVVWQPMHLAPRHAWRQAYDRSKYWEERQKAFGDHIARLQGLVREAKSRGASLKEQESLVRRTKLKGALPDDIITQSASCLRVHRFEGGMAAGETLVLSCRPTLAAAMAAGWKRAAVAWQAAVVEHAGKQLAALQEDWDRAYERAQREHAKRKGAAAAGAASGVDSSLLTSFIAREGPRPTAAADLPALTAAAWGTVDTTSIPFMSELKALINGYERIHAEAKLELVADPNTVISGKAKLQVVAAGGAAPPSPAPATVRVSAPPSPSSLAGRLFLAAASGVSAAAAALVGRKRGIAALTADVGDAAASSGSTVPMAATATADAQSKSKKAKTVNSSTTSLPSASSASAASSSAPVPFALHADSCKSASSSAASSRLSVSWPAGSIGEWRFQRQPFDMSHLLQPAEKHYLRKRIPSYITRLGGVAVASSSSGAASVTASASTSSVDSADLICPRVPLDLPPVVLPHVFRRPQQEDEEDAERVEDAGNAGMEEG